MAIVTLSEILKEAVPKRYAVGSFNAANHSMVEAILNAGEELGTPVILSVAEVHFRYFNLDHFISFIRNRLQNTSIPVALHLDHGLSLETIKRGLDLGFSSVMIDGSTLTYEENVKLTKEVVKVSQPYGASVEAELGHVGGGEGNLQGGTVADPSQYTDPKQAVSFVDETGVDALAIAIGTVHGPYQGIPHLELDILQEIRTKLDLPLVLHGGSGLSEEDLQGAIAGGINKINFFTEGALAAAEEIQSILLEGPLVSYPDLTIAAEKLIQEIIIDQIRIFGTQPRQI